MGLARLYINGEPWEIMGIVVDNFLGYSNDLQAARSGRIYANTESKVKTVAVDSVMADEDEFPLIDDFLNSCSGRRFNVTVEFTADNCGDVLGGLVAGLEYHYLDCMIQGEPEYSPAERKISGFEFGYSQRVTR